MHVLLRCNLCDSKNIKLLFYSKKYPNGHSGNIVRCGRCGLVFRDSWEKFGNKIRQDNGTEWRPGFPAAFTKKRSIIFDYYLKNISCYRKYNRILDVGSGYGYFLKFCFTRLNIDLFP